LAGKQLGTIVLSAGHQPHLIGFASGDLRIGRNHRPVLPGNVLFRRILVKGAQEIARIAGGQDESFEFVFDMETRIRKAPPLLAVNFAPAPKSAIEPTKRC
jgi:hypothetical protein